jgi:cobalt-zinc-cadmium efflux system membrane fusion protein
MDLHDPDTHVIQTDEPPPPAKRLTRRSQAAILGLVAGLAVIIFIVGPAGFRQSSGTTPDQQATDTVSASDLQGFKVTDKQWAALNIQPVKERIFQDASETDGKIAIDDDMVTPVFSPYSGRVTRLIAHAGDTVKKGDPLFGIQATELAQAQNDLITAVAALRTAKAQLNLATTNERRQHDLYAAQGAALKDWQQAQVDLATAQGGMNTTSVALAAVRNRLRIFGKSDHDIDQLESTPDILRVDADSLVSAPIGGTVVQRQIGLGQNIVSASSGASTPIFMIGDLSKVWLTGNVREEDATAMRIGDSVEVTVLAVPGKVFKARLTYVASSIDPNTHRLAVRAEVENPGGELKPEMFANFRIITGKDDAAPGVPDSAIVFEGDRAHVWLANAKAKTLEIRPIKIGRSSDGFVEAVGGLTRGDDIVTSGAVFIDRAVSSD